MPENEGYRVPEVCRVVGITYRQLDYWARTGLVTPSIRDAGGSGTQRLYSFADLVQLRVIRKLIDAGVSLQRIRKAIDYLQEHMRREPQGITLMSDGSRIYACETEDEIIDLLKQGQGVFAIALDKVWDDLSGSLAELSAPPKSSRRAKAAKASGTPLAEPPAVAEAGGA